MLFGRNQSPRDGQTESTVVNLCLFYDIPVAISLPEMGRLKDKMASLIIQVPEVAISLPEMGRLKVLKFVVSCLVQGRNQSPRDGQTESLSPITY